MGHLVASCDGVLLAGGSWGADVLLVAWDADAGATHNLSAIHALAGQTFHVSSGQLAGLAVLGERACNALTTGVFI